MTNRTVETSRQFYARLAGFTILFYIAVGFTSVTLYNRATDAEGTHAILLRIGEHVSAFRATILLELLESFSAIVLAVTLYGITRVENHELAMLAWSVVFAKVCWVLSESVPRWDCYGSRKRERVLAVPSPPTHWATSY